MRTSRGQMKGHLQYRAGTSGSWLSSYCVIDSPAGCLLTDVKGSPSHRCLLMPLRGCQVALAIDHELGEVVVNIISTTSAIPLQLQSVDTSRLHAWFAALLCWQSVRPGEQIPQSRTTHAEKLVSIVEDHRFIRHLYLQKESGKEAPVVKVGKLFVLENPTGTGRRADTDKDEHAPRINTETIGAAWRRASCILRENSELSIYDSQVSTVARLDLANLPRCAVQRLHPSVLGTDLCIAIYPQYTRSETSSSRLRPFYLSFDSRVLLEVWFVLLRTYCVPELYGTRRMHIVDCLKAPEILPGLSDEVVPGKFRLERALSVRICEVKLGAEAQAMAASAVLRNDSSSGERQESGAVHVEVSVDGHIKARTSAKEDVSSLYWFESFVGLDLASGSSLGISLVLCHGNGEKPKTLGSTSITFDAEHVTTTSATATEQWHALLDEHGDFVGEMLVTPQIREDVVLLDHEYAALSDILHDFSDGLTSQIADHLPLELLTLAEHLLNIFQVSGQATDWLTALAEQEIDGVIRESSFPRMSVPPSPMLLQDKAPSGSVANGLSSAGAGERVSPAREPAKPAIGDANLLFRGNTLLSKALDHHMKRLGKDYLEETLGAQLREIQRLNDDYEVDPAKSGPTTDVEKRWTRLLATTQKLWASIARSASRCPRELRVVFRHIQACARERYGDSQRSVAYSSVSGFLFLRFFCPAVLNPRLFGLTQGTRGLSASAQSLCAPANCSISLCPR